MPFGRKRNETGNQFEGLLGQGKEFRNERGMADLMVDMDYSVKKHSRRGLGTQSSKEYQNVQSAIKNVVFTTNGSFTNDVAANEKMMTQAMGNYYKLLAACAAYISKPGGFSMSGSARKNKVKEIQKYAQRDLMGIEQAFHAMKSMSGQQQSTLSWDEIFHSARMETLEVENYNDESINAGSAAKKGDLMGKRFEEGFFSPDHVKKYAEGGGASLTGSALADKEMNGKVRDVSTNIANRNIATSRVANLIGLGGIVEQSKSVKIHDKAKDTTKTGSLMTKAKGKEMLATIENEIQGKARKITDIQQRENMAKSKITPTMQKELSSLRVLDYLCGQGDRHRQNYFAEQDSSGNFTHVHGIDNDCSFATGVDFEKILRKDLGGVLIGSTHKRMVVDSSGNITLAHMDKQLAKNILDLKPEELRFALKDLLEEPFIEFTVQRLELLQIGIRNELNKPESKVFLEEQEWNDSTMEDFMQQSYRRKIMAKTERTGDVQFQPKMWLFENFSMDDRVEMSKGDSYIAALVDDMMDFNNLTNSYGRE